MRSFRFARLNEIIKLPPPPAHPHTGVQGVAVQTPDCQQMLLRHTLMVIPRNKMEARSKKVYFTP